MTTRTIHPDTLAAFEAGNFCPVVLVYLDWPEGPIRVHSGGGTITWGGHDWLGVGQFGELTVPEEVTGLAQQAATMTLIGTPDELDAYLDDPIRGRDADVYVGVVTERGGNVLIGEPFTAFGGFLDAMRDVLAREGDEIIRSLVLQVVNGPSQRSSVSVHHTLEDQQQDYPDDTFFGLFQHAEDRLKTLKWPA